MFVLVQSLPLYHKVLLHNIWKMYEYLVLADLLSNFENLDSTTFVTFFDS